MSARPPFVTSSFFTSPLFAFFVLVVWVAAAVALVYVAFHFVSKWW